MIFESLTRIGSGCGIEIRGDDLFVVCLKSRPAGVRVEAAATIEGFRTRSPEEWGGEYKALLEGCGMTHVAATVSLPREDVIVRQIHLPPMGRKEQAAAVRLQLDGLHPFGDDEIAHAYASIGGQTVVVVIAEKSRIDEYAEMFERAGAAIASFSVAAAGLYAAVRMRDEPPQRPFLVANLRGDAAEVYGESEQRPLLSAEFDLRSVGLERALQMATADLRTAPGESVGLAVCGPSAAGEDGEAAASTVKLAAEAAPELEPRSTAGMIVAPLSAPAGLDSRRDMTALGTAFESACPRRGWQANLLPLERRKSDSRLMWAPTMALAVLLGLTGLAFVLMPVVQDAAYRAKLESRLAELQADVAEVETLNAKAAQVRQRLEDIQTLHARTARDLAIISEISILLPDTAWLKVLELHDKGVELTGEAQSAAPLLGILTEAQGIERAAFSTSLVRIDEGERFQIAAQRRSPGSADEPAGVESVDPAPAAAKPAVAEPAATPAEEQPVTEEPVAEEPVAEEPAAEEPAAEELVDPAPAVVDPAEPATVEEVAPAAAEATAEDAAEPPPPAGEEPVQ